MKIFIILIFISSCSISYAADYYKVYHGSWTEKNWPSDWGPANMPGAIGPKKTYGDYLQYPGDIVDQTITGGSYYLAPEYSLFSCSPKTDGTYGWIERQYASGNHLSSLKSYLDSLPVNTAYPNPPTESCGPQPCALKKGVVNYDLKLYDDESSPPVDALVCYEDCQFQAQIQWNDCAAGSCVASVKYTGTGETCGSAPPVSDLDNIPPERCTQELNALISQCGGSLYIQSFDFETCSGTCTTDAPKTCSNEYNALIQKCGGVMGIRTWDGENCTGTCANDPVPNPTDPNSQTIPKDIKTETVTNSDGSKTITTTTTYNNTTNNTTYTTTTTTNYNSAGDVIEGSTTTTTTYNSSEDSDGEETEDPGEEEETFGGISVSGFGSSYTPGNGSYDIAARFTSFLNNVKSTGLFSFSSSFFNSLPGGGSPVLTIDGGQTFGTHIFDFSQALGGGLTILKSVLLALFGFLSIRAVIMKR